MIRCPEPGCRLGQAREEDIWDLQSRVIPEPAHRSPIALTNVRTGLRADAIATALIENLHCLQENCHSTQRGTTGTCASPTPFATA